MELRGYNVDFLLDCKLSPQLRSSVRKFAEGEALFLQGQVAETIYILLEGTVHLVSERDGEEQIVGEPEKGQVFGEEAVLRSSPTQRFHTAVAKSPVWALELSSNQLERLLASDPAMGFQIVRQIFQLIQYRFDRQTRLLRMLRGNGPRRQERHNTV
jgi:CRP-like cAMP-binding protein